MSGGYERSQIIRVQGRNGQLPEWEKTFAYIRQLLKEKDY